MTQPPEDPPEGENIGRIAESALPPELEETSGREEAVIFVPTGREFDPLDVRVVSIDPSEINDIIARRC